MMISYMSFFVIYKFHNLRLVILTFPNAHTSSLYLIVNLLNWKKLTKGYSLNKDNLLVFSITRLYSFENL